MKHAPLRQTDQPPPTDEVVLSTYAAARRVGVYVSHIRYWVEDGLLRGGVYRVRGREPLIWWVSRDDLDQLRREGNGLVQVGIKRRRQAEAEK